MFDPATLAQNASNPKAGADFFNDSFVMEPKMDGFRLLASVNDGFVDSFTRTGKSQKGKIPFIEQELAKLPAGTWLDGELVAFDSTGMPEWGAVQSVMGSTVSGAAAKSGCLTFVVFDLIAFDGTDIRRLPLATRRNALEQILIDNVDCDPQYVRLSEQMESREENHDELVAQGWEGTIVKRLDSPYSSGKRNQDWVKLKASDEMDVVIMGFKPGQNSFTGMVGAIEFGQYERCSECLFAQAGGVEPKPHTCEGGRVLKYRGRCSGMDMKFRRELTAKQEEFKGQVISLAYMGIMPSGSPRHPQFKRLRIDKPATACEWTR